MSSLEMYNRTLSFYSPIFYALIVMYFIYIKFIKYRTHYYYLYIVNKHFNSFIEL